MPREHSNFCIMNTKRRMLIFQSPVLFGGFDFMFINGLISLLNGLEESRYIEESFPDNYKSPVPLVV